MAISVLCGRWGRAPRSRLAGAGFKPPQAAGVKSLGGERCGKRRGLTASGVIHWRRTKVNRPMTCRNDLTGAETGVSDELGMEAGANLFSAQLASGIKAA